MSEHILPIPFPPAHHEKDLSNEFADNHEDQEEWLLQDHEEISLHGLAIQLELTMTDMGA